MTEELTEEPAQSLTQQITGIVERVLNITDVTAGTRDDHYKFRYRGKLRKESSEAFDQLGERLRRFGLMPMFRDEDEQHVVYLVNSLPARTPSNPWVNLGLFLATLFSMVFSGALQEYQGPISGNTGELIWAIIRNLKAGLPFGLSLLAILLAHEFGHYLAGRYHKTDVTLPYFIPFPFSPFGTMGAFIQLREPPKNKKILHDIGVAGPLAGLIVTIPILLYGLYLSPVEPLPTVLPPGTAFSLEGNSILYLAAKYVVHGEWLPSPATFGGEIPLVYWVKYFFTGNPIPLGGRDVLIHPMAFAGWSGLLVTALNLIPAGQLDGGHAMYVLFGKKAQRLLTPILVALILLGMVWEGWFLWAFLIYMFGRRHAEPLDQITPLDNGRKMIAIFTLLIFIFIFTPIPLKLIGGP